MHPHATFIFAIEHAAERREDSTRHRLGARRRRARAAARRAAPRPLPRTRAA
jgi:hypothetical protein